MSQRSIQTVATRLVYQNPWLRLREDAIVRSNGKAGIYSVVDKDDCAIILPLDRTPEGDFVYLVEQFRYTIQQTCRELPQGGWEQANVDPEQLARGELREETGITAERMTFLGTMHIAYGFANQKQHCFLAEVLTMGETELDEEEHDLRMVRVPLAEFEQGMRDGSIADASTLGCWALYKLRT
jgi:8-oxo-dGTP pyrophosphatase MutT (NUDIX family)